jgi:hypothetical protein
VANRGNVAFKIGQIGEVGLEDEELWCRSGRMAIGPWADRAEAGVEDLVAGAFRVMRDEVDRAANLRVHNRADETEVEPNAVTTLELDVTVPPGLHKSTRYRGRAPLLTADLEFVVVPSRIERAESGPPARARTQRPARATSEATARVVKQVAKKSSGGQH